MNKYFNFAEIPRHAGTEKTSIKYTNGTLQIYYPKK